MPVAKPKTSTASKPDPSNAAIKQSPISPSVEGSALGASDDNEDDSSKNSGYSPT